MGKLRLLHLEDSPTDAFLVRNALAEAGIAVEIVHAASRAEFLFRIKSGTLDAILVDSGLPDITSCEAIEFSRTHQPRAPIIVVSNAATPQGVNEMLRAGAADYILKGHWWQLVCALRRTQVTAGPPQPATHPGLTRLVRAMHSLSLARDLASIMTETQRAARELMGTEGAAFVLREGDQCHYADENAIEPLWKGQRLPLNACICGWAMENQQAAVCSDVYADTRIPQGVYQTTFVKSLLVVPVRQENPIGAIGCYWATQHTATPEEVELLQALANTTAVAMDNVAVYADLERRVRSRTMQLEAANHELEAFSYSVAHDLRGPLHAVSGYADLMAIRMENSADKDAQDFLSHIHAGVERMNGLIDDLLRLAKIGRAELVPTNVDLSAMAKELFGRMTLKDPKRSISAKIQPGLRVEGDEGMMRIVLENLMANAWKYTSRRGGALVELGELPDRDGQAVFFIRDNGAGFDPRQSEKLFAPFQRLHRPDEFEGTGIGLATVQRIIHRHGGLVWAEGKVDQGATFYFSMPKKADDAPANAEAHPTGGKP
jgi:signal transduction histidine kinase/DNA-binding NarL/FixJ family response regulator